MQKWKLKVAVVMAVTAAKIGLIPGYRSTDFEVHRNWLAITGSLPLNQWYTAEGSEWTLDYPPLFAWFECLLAQAARFVDPGMPQVTTHGYASDATVVFQRFSVILTDAVLISGAWYATRRMPAAKSLAVFVLVVAHPGLLIVDHIHFQYNGMLLGILVWSIALIQEGRCLSGAFLFAVLVNMKHLFASLGPLYFTHLLRGYCRGPHAVQRFTALGAVVVGVCGLSFGPFIAHGQLGQVLSRLFPFGRGLNHAYWAANVWALYTLADKGLAKMLGRAKPLASSTGGLVGQASFAVLPDVTPGACAALVLASMLPVLGASFLWPRREHFAASAAYMALCSFMLGYHVHEKAILTALIPLVLTATDGQPAASQYVFLSVVGSYALFPLLFTWQEYPIKVLLLVAYHLLALELLRNTEPGPAELVHTPGKDITDTPMKATAKATPRKLASGKVERLRQTDVAPSNISAGQGNSKMLHLWQIAYLIGLAGVELYAVVLHPWLTKGRYAFLPLLLVSVYGAFGLTAAWLLMAARLIIERRGANAGLKTE